MLKNIPIPFAILILVISFIIAIAEYIKMMMGILFSLFT